MLFRFSLSLVLAIVSTDLLASETRPFDGATPLQWSERLAQSEIKRLGSSLEAGNGKARWDYSPSVFALALVNLSEATARDDYRQYGVRAVGSHVKPDGTIENYKREDFSLDEILPGRVLLSELARAPNAPFQSAVETLRAQLAAQPRNQEGGFWHKQRYPQQMWLDGLYMGSPFLAQYGALYNEPLLFDEVTKQISLIDQHLYDPATGLYWHGWDESHRQSWADPKTGRSPNFWSRAIGWYGMALVDSLDYLPSQEPQKTEVVATLQRVADGIVRWQDSQTGAWWQITNFPERKGNYLEASGSAMFVYTLAKGVNRGYLPREKYADAIIKGYAGLIHEFIRTGFNGEVSLTRICKTAGLGYTTSEGRPRDGSFNYYISEPIVDNDPKGTGPFILAGIEVEKMLSPRDSKQASIAPGWDALPAVLARIQPPRFPAHDFPITDFGAKPNLDATRAINGAIEACHTAGGGRVLVPAGEWLTGAIRLRSEVNLYLAPGAVLRFSADPAAYPNVLTRWEGIECYNHSPLIYALDEKNIAVTGEGTLDGQAALENWWGWTKRGTGRDRASADLLSEMGERGVPVAQRNFGAGYFLRPIFIQPYRCTNVLIEGVTIVRSPMWEINPELCTNVIVRGVKIDSRGPNNDGCDPESSRDVLIENCTFDTGDDCIAIKSGRNNDGRRVGVPSENIVVRHCIMKDGHGGVVVGSEISGGCRNVYIEDCVMDSPGLDRALRIKSNARRGGVIENVFMRRVQVGRVAEAILTIDLLYEEGAHGEFPPTVRNIDLDHITSSASPRVLWINGFSGATIDGVRLTDCTFNGVESAELVSGAGRVEFNRVEIRPLREQSSRNSRPLDNASAPAK